jgi:hypothetical protein
MLATTETADTQNQDAPGGTSQTHAGDGARSQAQPDTGSATKPAKQAENGQPTPAFDTGDRGLSSAHPPGQPGLGQPGLGQPGRPQVAVAVEIRARMLPPDAAAERPQAGICHPGGQRRPRALPPLGRSHDGDWTAPGILDAVIPGGMHSHVGTAEVPEIPGYPASIAMRWTWATYRNRPAPVSCAMPATLGDLEDLPELIAASARIPAVPQRWRIHEPAVHRHAAASCAGAGRGRGSRDASGSATLGRPASAERAPAPPPALRASGRSITGPRTLRM